MSMITSFPRRALERQAFVAVGLFALAMCLIWTGIALGWALDGDRPFLTPWRIALVGAFVAAYILWRASRRPRAEIRSWTRLRIMWRRRHWVELFGFAVAVMLLGIGLGAFCSLSHWFSDRPDQAAQYSLTYMALAGLLGFFSGFSLHLPGAGYADLGSRELVRRKPDKLHSDDSLLTSPKR